MLKIKHTINNIDLSVMNYIFISKLMEKCDSVSPNHIHTTHSIDTENSTLNIELEINSEALPLQPMTEIVFLLGNIFGLAQAQLQLGYNLD